VDVKRDPGSIKLLGGRLCLDFVNTVDCYGCSDLGEYLNNYQDLVFWCRHVGMITDQEAKTLSTKSTENPAEAKRTHHLAIELREIVYRIFSSIAEGKFQCENDLAVFNDYLSKTMRWSQIVKTKNGFYWDILGNKMKLDWIINPVIRSAADLLISEELQKIKKCSDPTCGWLFLDSSRNRSRRWCDMRDCGNRAKASRYYKKKKKSNTASAVPKPTPSPQRSTSGLKRHLL